MVWNEKQTSFHPRLLVSFLNNSLCTFQTSPVDTHPLRCFFFLVQRRTSRLSFDILIFMLGRIPWQSFYISTYPSTNFLPAVEHSIEMIYCPSLTSPLGGTSKRLCFCSCQHHSNGYTFAYILLCLFSTLVDWIPGTELPGGMVHSFSNFVRYLQCSNIARNKHI